jgi:hypothetical protein
MQKSWVGAAPELAHPLNPSRITASIKGAIHQSLLSENIQNLRLRAGDGLGGTRIDQLAAARPIGQRAQQLHQADQ